MKWKESVIVKKTKKCGVLHLGEQQTKIEEKDRYIAAAIEKGMCEEEELTELVMKKEETSRVLAGFRLAQFVLDYSDYLSEDVGHMEIEP